MFKKASDRYIIIDTLGKGGIATTYRAFDINSNTEVAIKTISLSGINNWKQIELFEREAKILQQLDHPGIPKYIDYFEVDSKENRYFYLVQQLAPGISLYDLITNNWCPDEQEVKNIAISILKILIYLQQLSPPIIHRDIKPRNIVRQENGEVFLVDFGAVANVYNHTFNSTVVGTFGYMSPEQFRGKATLSTDIYGLGTTLLFLLTKKCPGELPQHHLTINFRPYVEVDKHFANWLEKSIMPNFNNRFQNAFDALEALEKRYYLQPAKLISKPQKTLIKLINEKDKLFIIIPSIKDLKYKNIHFWVLANLPYIFLLSLILILSLILFFSDFEVLVYYLLLSVVTGKLILILSFFCFLIFLFKTYWFWKKEIIICSLKMYLATKKRVQPDMIINEPINNYPIKAQLKKYKIPFIKKHVTYCLLIRNLKPQSFGFFLDRKENEWLVQEINCFLGNKD